MNTQVNSHTKFLRTASDGKGGHLVMYYLDEGDKIHKFEPVKVIAHVREEMTGILSTIRYLKDDLVAQPSEAIVRASDVSEAYFNREFPEETIEKMTEEYLKDLPEKYNRLGELLGRLEQLELAHEAGILSNDGKEFAELLSEFSGELGVW